MSYPTNGGFPSQRRTKSQKTKKWATQCVDYAEGHTAHYNEGVRKSRRSKYLNYRLYDGYIDITDMELTINPYQTVGTFISDNIPHYPIAAPKIDLIVGEELNRRFEYKVVVSNPDAISEKERTKAEMWKKKLLEVITENKSEEEVAAILEKYDKYLKFDWQDIKELTATNILRHYGEKQHFKNIFNECIKDVCLAGEEIVQCEIVSNEPIMHKLNPLNITTVRSGGSPWIQDADLIIIEDYWNPGKIADVFHEDLKPSDLKKIEENYIGNAGVPEEGGGGNIHSEPQLYVAPDPDADQIEDLINLSQMNGGVFGNHYDTNGNVRILRVYWRSFRKIKKVKYYDEDGDVQYDYFPEDYKPDEDRGEEATTLWVNEMWEGTKIGDDIYIKLQPMPIQFNDINNPSKCHAGIIGLVHNTNQMKSTSMMDRMKQYQYLYDATKDRTNKAMAKWLGPLLELDLAKVPKHWTMDKWLHFAYSNGLAVIDSFREGNKGTATGKLAGNFNTTGGAINLQMGNYIQNQIEFLEYIKLEMSQIVGITPQREGAISNRETVGGVERSVNQSSHITEQLFAKHELFKAKALETFLEVAKISFKNGNKKLQYVLGDESIQMLEIDDTFSEGCYDILISFNNKYQQLDSIMKELAQAGIQNDKMDFSTLMTIYMSNSLSEMKRSIEVKEQEKLDRDQKAVDRELQARQYEADKKAETEREKMDAEERQSIRETNAKLLIAGIDKDKFDEDGISKDIELLKHKDDLEYKFAELAQEDRHHKDDIRVEEKKIKATKAKAK